MNQQTSRTQPLLVLVIAFVMLLSLVNVSKAQSEKRSVRGQIYFSNNTPPNIHDFPIELLISDQKKVVRATTLNESGEFYLEDVESGKYVLRITQPNKCSLLYRIDIQTRSITNIRVVMDAECAHTNGKLTDLPE